MTDPQTPAGGLTPTERAMRARLAAYSQHAQGRTNTAAARAAFHNRFEREVDPNGELDPAERAKRAEAARSAHFTRLAYASARARRGKSPRPPRQAGGEVGA